MNASRRVVFSVMQVRQPLASSVVLGTHVWNPNAKETTLLWDADQQVLPVEQQAPTVKCDG